jgi:hypothetical protein
MRLELTLEPGMEPPEAPDFMPHTVSQNRRFIARVEEKNVARAIEWARDLREKGIAEEFSVGPTTLEDVYLRMIGRLDALEMTQGAGNA